MKKSNAKAMFLLATMAMGVLASSAQAAFILTDTFDMYNSSLAQLQAQDATFESFDAVALNAEDRSVNPWKPRYGTNGLGVRNATGEREATFAMSTDGHGAGDYILRLSGILSSSSREGRIFLVVGAVETLLATYAGITGINDIPFTAGASDIVGGKLNFKVFGPSGSAFYIDLPGQTGGGAGGAGAELLFDVVPEPASLGLLLVGGMLMGLQRRQR